MEQQEYENKFERMEIEGQETKPQEHLNQQPNIAFGDVKTWKIIKDHIKNEIDNFFFGRIIGFLSQGSSNENDVRLYEEIINVLKNGDKELPFEKKQEIYDHVSYVAANKTLFSYELKEFVKDLAADDKKSKLTNELIQHFNVNFVPFKQFYGNGNKDEATKNIKKLVDEAANNLYARAFPPKHSSNSNNFVFAPPSNNEMEEANQASSDFVFGN